MQSRIINELKQSITEEMVKYLDTFTTSVLSKFEAFSDRIVTEDHGNISYVVRSNITVNFRGKFVVIRGVDLIKEMYREDSECDLFEVRLNFSKHNAWSLADKELIKKLEENPLIYKELFIVGSEKQFLPKSFDLTTLNKCFLAFFDKRQGANLYTGAFNLLKDERVNLLNSVYLKGDDLNDDSK